MSGWKVLLFRHLVDGDVDGVEKIAQKHPSSIHEHFTRGMQQWELEWDSLKWYEFLDSTCLYIASCYAHVEIVRWLLDSGVNPYEKCYCNQRSIDVVGACRQSPEETKEIMELLSQPLQPPRAPMRPKCEMKLVYGSNQLSDGSDTPVRSVICRANLGWQCYWVADGCLFELRYREMGGDNLRTSTRNYAAGKNDDGLEKWHSLQTHSVRKTLTDLIPGHTYEIQVRASNGAGWGPYSEKLIATMPLPLAATTASPSKAHASVNANTTTPTLASFSTSSPPTAAQQQQQQEEEGGGGGDGGTGNSGNSGNSHSHGNNNYQYLSGAYGSQGRRKEKEREKEKENSYSYSDGPSTSPLASRSQRSERGKNKKGR